MEKNEAMNNYLHECCETKVQLIPQNVSLLDSPFSADEIALVWDFYVSHAPIRKNQDEKGEEFGLRCLVDYGWKGVAGLSSLERHLIRSANLKNTVVIKASGIKETLAAMNLSDKICCKHPRAVILQEHTIKLEETGKVNITANETRMVCLFRHIRNSLAHNRIYFFENGSMILLEDISNSIITARILIPTHCLIDWIRAVDKDCKFYTQKNAPCIESTATIAS